MIFFHGHFTISLAASYRDQKYMSCRYIFDLIYVIKVESKGLPDLLPLFTRFARAPSVKGLIAQARVIPTVRFTFSASCH